MGCLRLDYLEFTELCAEKNNTFARGSFGVDVVVAAFNHVAHMEKTAVADDGDGGCLTCPKNATDGQIHRSIIDGSNLQYRNGNWVEVPSNTSFDYNGKSYWAMSPIGGDVPLGPAGPAKGIKYLAKMMKNPNLVKTSVKQFGKFWEYSAKIAGKDGSFTKYYRYYNSEGRTIKFFHDTYDGAGRFLHREFMMGQERIKIWENGARQWFSKWK